MKRVGISQTCIIASLMFFIGFLFIATIPLGAQTIDWDSDPTEAAVEGVINVTSSIIADSLTPMTHYEKGDVTLSLVPAYFEVDRLYDDPDLRGDDLKGWGFGLGGGYALSDRWMFYGILSGMNIEGTAYDKENPDFEADTEYSLYTLNAGFGFDIVDGGRWSIPLFFGISLQRYSADISLPPITAPLYTEVEVTADGFLYAVTAGLAVSGEFLNMFRITPYFLMIRSLNKPEITAEVTQENPFPLPALSEDIDLELDPVQAGMLGLSLTFLGGSSWSISVSVGGYLASSSGYYNDIFLDGLEMKSVVLVFSYTGIASENQ